MEWRREGWIELNGRIVNEGGFCVEQAGKFLARAGDRPKFREIIVADRKPRDLFRILCAEGNSGIHPDDVRLATIFLGFCLYIVSLKPEGEVIEPTGRRNRSRTRTPEEQQAIDEAVAIEQAVVMKSAGILKSGKRRKTVATGEGTKHRYRYLVRGHERIVGDRIIWVKPQIRGEGEFIVLPTATSSDLQAAIPETPVTVNAMPQTESQTREEPTRVLCLPEPRKVVPTPRQRPIDRLVMALGRFFDRLFRT